MWQILKESKAERKHFAWDQGVPHTAPAEVLSDIRVGLHGGCVQNLLLLTSIQGMRAMMTLPC